MYSLLKDNYGKPDTSKLDIFNVLNLGGDKSGILGTGCMMFILKSQMHRKATIQVRLITGFNEIQAVSLYKQNIVHQLERKG